MFGRAPGETTLFAVDADEKVVLDLSIAVALNLTRLNEFLRDIAPSSTVLARSVARGIVLTGGVADAASAANAERLARQFVAEDALIINQIQINGPNQVNLRVRVAEVSRSTLKRFGLNIDFLQTAGDFVFGIASGNIAGAGSSFATRNNGSFNAFGGIDGTTGDLNLLVDALETEGRRATGRRSGRPFGFSARLVLGARFGSFGALFGPHLAVRIGRGHRVIVGALAGLVRAGIRLGCFGSGRG